MFEDIPAAEMAILQTLQAGLETGRTAAERQWLACALVESLGMPQRHEVVARLLSDTLAADQAGALRSVSDALATATAPAPTPA